MENYLFPYIRMMKEDDKKWLNVQNVEQKFLSQESLGRWLDDQTEVAKDFSWKLDFSTVQDVINPSAKR